MHHDRPHNQGPQGQHGRRQGFWAGFSKVIGLVCALLAPLWGILKLAFASPRHAISSKPRSTNTAGTSRRPAQPKGKQSSWLLLPGVMPEAPCILAEEKSER